MSRKRIVEQSFFDQSTVRVARALLGKFLVRKKGNRMSVAMITEVEAYAGLRDKASHASRGKTPRTQVMFGGPGVWYVYLIYGMHYCLNIVTEKEEYPATVLIRGVGGISGPGRVCRFFEIDKTMNALPSSKKTGLWIEDRGIKINPRMIKHGKRIGVDYAGTWKDKPWRFYLTQ